MKCPKCHRETGDRMKVCRCGFDFKNSSLRLLTPMRKSVVSRIEKHIEPLPGWGPKRPLFTMESPANYAVFNSIKNSSAIGDERSFVLIIDKERGGTFSSSIEIEPGKEYEVYIYYHNDAAIDYNDMEHNQVGVAMEVRLTTSFPDELIKGEKDAVIGIIRSKNANPPSVWGSAYVTAKENVTLHYIKGSLKIYNFWNQQGTLLSTDAFSADGTFLGLKELNGIIFGGDKFAGSITYTFLAKAMEEESPASVADGGLGSEIVYRSGNRYVGDVQNGKRHGIGMMEYVSGDCIEGVWENDAFSEKLTSWRSDCSYLRFDHKIWRTFEQNSLTEEEKARVVKTLEEELEVRVGGCIGQRLTVEERLEFEQIEDIQEVATWLHTHIPNYDEIVLLAYSEFKDEIIRDWLNGTGHYIPGNSEVQMF